MKKRSLIACFCLIVLLIATPALAGVVKPNSDYYVYDGAGVLSDETEGVIVFSNDLLYRDTGAQFVVVTVNSTGNEDIADYAYDLFNDWEIGDSKEQNGFLLLLAIGDDDYYYLPGTGIDYELSGGTIRPIVDQYLEPYFAAGQYDEGVRGTFEQIFTRLARVTGSSATVSQGMADYQNWLVNGGERPEGYHPGSNRAEQIRAVLIIILLIILLTRTGGRRRGGFVNNMLWYSLGSAAGRRRYRGGFGGGRSGGGGGSRGGGGGRGR